ncbi:MAG: glycosyltransferase family 4 protein [Thermoguttaceae bacterium]
MTEHVRILFLIDDFCGPEGGTEQHLLFLQRELPRDLFDLHFVVLTGIQRMDAEDFPVRPVMLVGRRHGARGVPERLLLLASYIRRAGIDVVHAFSRTSEIYACLAVRLAKRGRVLAIRRNLGYWHTWPSRWVARAVGRLGAAYAANCEAARQYTSRVEWIRRRRIAVIHNPLATARIAEGRAAGVTRASLGVADGERLVGMVATVRPVKDYATFLHAARHVIDREPPTRFLAVGFQQPEYSAQMQRLCGQLGIACRVTWLGAVANPFTLLPLLDVAVLSSSSEAFSNAVLEYAAAGVPTVATDVGGIRELLDDGTSGFIVPPRDPETMADRICRLLSDRELGRRLGDAARRKVTAEFSEDKILSQYRRIYHQLAGRSGDDQR